MLKLFLLICLSITVSACGDNTQSQQPELTVEPVQVTLLEQYRNQAANVLTIIYANEGAKKLEQESAKLVELSQLLLNELAAEVPQCKRYLTSLNAAASEMVNLPVEKIASDYLNGHKLPNFNKPICYHIKEVLVHGATVQAIARQGLNNKLEYKTAELDIIEAIAHFDQVEAQFAD